MEDETSWVTHSYNHISREVTHYEALSDITNDIGKDSLVSLDLILPDDLLERILAYLPIASILRARSVCKRWNEIVNSRRFLLNFSNILLQKPWYFMFTNSGDPGSYAYDPILRKWYSFKLPCIEAPNCTVASSFGLVCFMDSESRSELYVCNPVTKICSKLEEPPGLKFTDYSALAISVDRKSHCYTVAVAKSKQVPDDFLQWDLSIHVYDSETKSWVTSVTEVLTGWRGGDESVICDGIFYCLIYSTGVVGGSENRHCLIMYDLSGRNSHASLIRTCIQVPCSLTCGRLMNLRDKLVMVGGIGKQDRPDIIKGIGIWLLNEKEWWEVSRMPHKFFQGFGEFDDVFASSGTDDLIYIQSYGAPALLVFDMKQRQWRWSQKCPVTKRFPLQLFTGFCFEPRLEVIP
ncbi:F-box/kelch-repeat protein At3g61590-like [Tasmannia lanceolata]|uniref:F-box/kelch-repeat protein At3g61590-like n=1 Tax=Tasmannia lanceolata TaxID=3420 RepID=UPI0040629109